ncbi:MAG: ABC transporter substrate-binding protein [Acidobacteria bacterium]|nr:MAG: ABC transporter substrate-binding protein [Acidobacteriota bacterium]
MVQNSNQPGPGTSKAAVELNLAHSPDSDDAFMFYALATKKIPTGNMEFVHVLEDIETLNQKARAEVYDITAVSFHAYAELAERYILMSSGASFGDGYGPIIVTRTPMQGASLKGKRVAIPGKKTTAFLALCLYEPDFEPVETRFDGILDKVIDGQVDAGVVIHEGQLTYGSYGLARMVDLGVWWKNETGLPLPLGGNVIRRALDPEVIRRADELLRESIAYGLEHRDEALEYALNFARGLEPATAEHFVSMYVNQWTLDYGEQGRRAVQTLLDRGFEAGIIPQAVKAEFVRQ